MNVYIYIHTYTPMVHMIIHMHIRKDTCSCA